MQHPLSAGDSAAHLHDGELFVVVGEPDAPAGELEVDPAGTLDEWIDVDPDADVLDVVGEQRIDDAIGRFAGTDDVLAAVRDDRITPQAVPAGRLVPVLREFLAARRAGEWTGVVDYVRDTGGVA